MEKSKSFAGYSTPYASGFEDRQKSYSFNGPKSGAEDDDHGCDASGNYGNGNPEVKRRKRVASYNMYTVQGNLKSSLRNSFKWIKNKFTNDFGDHQ